jgi:putative membrane protein
MEHGHGFAMEGSAILWVVIIAAVVIIALVVILNRTGDRRQKKFEVNRDETPMDILKKRYALGEITKEEFEEVKKDLLEE